MSWDKNGEYVPDIAGRDIDPRREYDVFKQQRDTFFTNVQQQIEAGEYYPRDPIGQEDYMFSGIAELAEHGVITDAEALSIYSSWIAKRRPDTTVIHVKPQPPRGARYE